MIINVVGGDEGQYHWGRKSLLWMRRAITRGENCFTSTLTILSPPDIYVNINVFVEQPSLLVVALFIHNNHP